MARRRRTRGTGGLFRPTYEAPDGTRREQTIWWIAYRNEAGRLKRESTGTTVRVQAEAILASRLQAKREGQLTAAERIRKLTLGDLEDMVVADHKDAGRDAGRVRIVFRPLLVYFGGGDLAQELTDQGEQSAAGRKRPARSLSRDVLVGFRAARRDAGAATATINRSIAALRRAFRLAALPYPPGGFPMQSESDNVREGFVERDQFEAIRDKAVDWLQPVLTFLYWTGWRRAEVLGLEWRKVDFKAGVIRLEPGTTKNKQGREVPFYTLPELRECLEAQRRLTTELERASGKIVPVVFHENGEPLLTRDGGKVVVRRSVYPAWQAACRAAGLPGRLLHDFRRSAVRNMERSGVSRSVAMKVTGHKTESIYKRYAIVNEADIAEGLAKVAALPQKAKAQS